MDAAGLWSHPAWSNGFIIDVTPPEAISNYVTGANLIKDGSFEEMNNDWFLYNKSYITSEGSKSGKYSVFVLSVLEQTINQATSGIAKLQFWTKSCQGENHESVHGFGIVTLDEMMHSFQQDKDNVMWQRHVFFTHLTETNHTLTFKQGSDEACFLLDDVTIESVLQNHTAAYPDIVLDIIPTSHYEEGFVTASWHFMDAESDIAEYVWALGTVKGMKTNSDRESK